MTAQKNIRARYKKEQMPIFLTIVSSAKALCVSVITASLLMLLLAAVMIRLADPVAYIDTAAWVCLGLSCIFAGCASHLISKDEYMRVSLVSGCMFSLLLFMLSIATDSITSFLYTALGYCGVVLLHLIGAALSKKLFGSRRRRKVY